MKDKFYSLMIKEITDESFDSKSIIFHVDDEITEQFNYKQGQHVYVRVKIDGMEHYRPYSITSAPYEKEFKLTIKRYRGGIVSNFINDSLKVGHHVEMMAPQGDFYTDLDPENNKQYYIIGAGSGISPLLSLLKETLTVEPKSKIYLFYGNRNEESIIFDKELKDLQKKYSDRLFIEFILSAPKKHRKPGLLGFLKPGVVKWKGLTGHIDHHTLVDFFKKYPVVNKNDMNIFICGPDGMIRSSMDFFVSNGIDEKQILTESFNREYENILPGGIIDQCKTKIHYKGEQYDVDLDDQRPILDNLLKEELIIPFACRSGLCSACIARVVNGEVNSRETKGLTKEMKELGYILSCQSTPATTELEIDYDTPPPSV